MRVGSTSGSGSGGQATARRQQRGAEVGGAGVTILGAACHGLEHHPLDLAGDVGADLAGAEWVAAQARQRHRHRRVPVPRWPSAQRLVEHEPEGVHVGAGIHRPALDLLGRQVLGGAEDQARPGELAGVGAGLVERLGHAEVGDERPGRAVDQVVLGEQDVGRLDVAVDDADVVGVAQRGGGLAADGQHVAAPASAPCGRATGAGSPR